MPYLDPQQLVARAKHTTSERIVRATAALACDDISVNTWMHRVARELSDCYWAALVMGRWGVPISDVTFNADDGAVRRYHKIAGRIARAVTRMARVLRAGEFPPVPPEGIAVTLLSGVEDVYNGEREREAVT
jgi:hypothetical protein